MMLTVTVSSVNASSMLQRVISELAQVSVVFDAISDSIIPQTTDENVANAFYGLQELYYAKLKSIVELQNVV